jgi:hypothetical protein
MDALQVFIRDMDAMGSSASVEEKAVSIHAGICTLVAAQAKDRPEWAAYAQWLLSAAVIQSAASALETGVATGAAATLDGTAAKASTASGSDSAKKRKPDEMGGGEKDEADGDGGLMSIQICSRTDDSSTVIRVSRASTMADIKASVMETLALTCPVQRLRLHLPITGQPVYAAHGKSPSDIIRVIKGLARPFDMVFDRAVAGASSAYTITVGDGRLGLRLAARPDGTTEVRKVGGQCKAADVEVGDTLVSMTGQPALVDTALTRVIFAECAAPVLIMSQQAVSLEMVMQLRAELVAIKQDHDSELDAVIETTQNKHRTEIQTQTTLLSTTLQDLRAQADGETCQICSWKFPAASNSGVSRIAFCRAPPKLSGRVCRPGSILGLRKCHCRSCRARWWRSAGGSLRAQQCLPTLIAPIGPPSSAQALTNLAGWPCVHVISASCWCAKTAAQETSVPVKTASPGQIHAAPAAGIPSSKMPVASASVMAVLASEGLASSTAAGMSTVSAVLPTVQQMGMDRRTGGCTGGSFF